MINVSEHILKFRRLLIDCWADLDSLMENHDWDNDESFIDEWLQSTWEFLVERQLLQKNGSLRSFGEYKTESRVTRKEKIATHEIICIPKKNKTLIDGITNTPINKNIRLAFCVFLKRLPVSYGLYPPFDYAGVFSIKDKKLTRYRIPVDDVDFFLDTIR